MMMTTEYVASSADATVADVLAHIRTVERSRETVYSVFLLEPQGRLVATVSLRQLIAAEPTSRAIDLARGHDPITVAPSTDREEVAHLIRRHDLLALPVVDEQGRPMGIVTVRRRARRAGRRAYRGYAEVRRRRGAGRPLSVNRFLAMIRKRAGWLSILFFSEMLTASAMQHFGKRAGACGRADLFIP